MISRARMRAQRRPFGTAEAICDRGQARVITGVVHSATALCPASLADWRFCLTKAAIVRRIFASYVAGQSPRDIAGALNREEIPAPRGGCWNASTIGGSRTRQNGILQNRLYIGHIVWNRQSFIKNPENGRRVSRPNPRSDWMEGKASELRIIDDATWNAVQHRRGKRCGATRHHASRPRRLLSGLLKCGKCGSGCVVSGADKRGPYLRCSRPLESGACDNKRTVSTRCNRSDRAARHRKAPLRARVGSRIRQGVSPGDG